MECWCWQDPMHWSGLVLLNHHGKVSLTHSVVYVSRHTVEFESRTLAYDRHMTASFQSSEYDHSVMKLHQLGHHCTIICQSLINVMQTCDFTDV